MPDKTRLIHNIKSKDWLLLSIFWVVIITGLSSIPGNEIPESKLWEFDKLGHFAVYALLSFFLSAWKMKQYEHVSNVLILYILPVILGSLLGTFLEYAQGNWLSGRYFDLLDVIANIIGCIAGVILAAILLKNKKYGLS